MGQVYHIKTREEFGGLGDAASGPRLPVLRDPSPTSGLGASRGIAIANVCIDLLARQAERNVRILDGDEM